MTKYHSKKRDESYQLYAQGMLISKVAKKVGVDRKTLNVWKEKFSWEDRKNLIDERAGQKVDRTLTENKVEQIKIFTATLYQYAKQLKEGKEIKDKEGKVIMIIPKEITPHEAVNVGKMLLTLYGEADISFEDKNITEMIKWMKEIAPSYQDK